jgi:hypothetical protein
MGALGWRELSAPTRDALWRITSVADTESLNVNTAPLAVLEALVGERARALAAAREQAPIVAQENLEAAIGIQTRGDGLILAFRPSDSFRLTVMFPADGRELESQLVITGRDADRPYYWREIQPERAIFAAVRASWALPQSEALNAP